MMLPHYLYPQINAKISDGDTLLIRFRLHSDSYGNGWGWAIDDLRINPLVNHVDELITNDLIVFPNPGIGLINIDIGNANIFKPVEISVCNASGKNIVKNQFYPDETIILNITECPQGLYIIKVKSDLWIKSVKYAIIK